VTATAAVEAHLHQQVHAAVQQSVALEAHVRVAYDLVFTRLSLEGPEVAAQLVSIEARYMDGLLGRGWQDTPAWEEVAATPLIRLSGGRYTHGRQCPARTQEWVPGAPY
jgi:formylglycine-generating enzyme required for sulfatase activity